VAQAQVSQSAFEEIIAFVAAGQVSQSAFEIIVVGIPDPPSAPGNPQKTTGGIPAPLRQCGPRPTPYDWCLEQEIWEYRQIQFPPLCCIPKAFRNSTPWDEQQALPAQAKPFYREGGITTPAAAAGDQILCQFLVPTGYDGLLSGFFFGYSGQGFTQGSGDILFRIKTNQYYVKDLGNVPYLIGSTKYPCPMTEGKVLYSDQRVQAIVNVPNLSGMIQVGASTVFAGLFGFWWPRGSIQENLRRNGTVNATRR
jgi:hypothetical protein